MWVCSDRGFGIYEPGRVARKYLVNKERVLLPGGNRYYAPTNRTYDYA